MAPTCHFGKRKLFGATKTHGFCPSTFSGWLEPSNLMKFTHIYWKEYHHQSSHFGVFVFFPALCCMCLLSLKQTPVFLGCLLHTTYVSASVFVDRYFCGFKLGGADRNRSARDPSGFEDPLSFPRWFDDSMMIRHVRWNQGVTCGIFSHETRNVWGEYCVVSKTHRYTINILYFEVKNRHIMFTFKGQSFMSTHDCTWIQTPS